MKADLHCHCKESDGSLTMEELLSMAARMGMTAVGITNHDTMRGMDRACALGKALGVEVVPGMEISAWDFARKRKVHLLCYMPENVSLIEQFCYPTVERRRDASEKMMQQVTSLYPVPPEMIRNRASGSTNIYKQHIMHALMECGYTQEIFGDLFRTIFRGKGAPAHFPVTYPDIRDAADAVRAAKGIAVLAHPFVYDSHDLMEELVRENRIDGIEVYHTRCRMDQSMQLADFARAHRLLMTGGSDFHGLYSDHPVRLGDRTTPEDCFRALMAFKKCM